MIGDSVNELQLSLFAVFNVLFVAPGVMAQLQPLFIARRDIYDAREKKSKMYSWQAFVTGLIVSEVPYLGMFAPRSIVTLSQADKFQSSALYYTTFASTTRLASLFRATRLALSSLSSSSTSSSTLALDSSLQPTHRMLCRPH